jgi:hypothetical protein
MAHVLLYPKTHLFFAPQKYNLNLAIGFRIINVGKTDDFIVFYVGKMDDFCIFAVGKTGKL